MKATIDTHPDRHEIRVELKPDQIPPAGATYIAEHRDEDTGDLTSREAVWVLGADIDPKAWAKQEIKPLLAASGEPDPEKPKKPKTSTVTL